MCPPSTPMRRGDAAGPMDALDVVRGARQLQLRPAPDHAQHDVELAQGFVERPVGLHVAGLREDRPVLRAHASLAQAGDVGAQVGLHDAQVQAREVAAVALDQHAGQVVVRVDQGSALEQRPRAGQQVDLRGRGQDDHDRRQDGVHGISFVDAPAHHISDSGRSDGDIESAGPDGDAKEAPHARTSRRVVLRRPLLRGGQLAARGARSGRAPARVLGGGLGDAAGAGGPLRRAAAGGEPARLDAAAVRAPARTWARPTARRTRSSCLGLFRSWGYDARIEEFDVLFPTPKTRVLEMIAPTALRRPAWSEPALEGGRDLGAGRRAAPRLQRVLDRRRRDGRARLRQLRRARRTTRSWSAAASTSRARSCSRATAAPGAGSSPRWRPSTAPIGCLIYSDPRDDGYFQGDVYPEGRLRHATRARSAARWRTCRCSRATR